MNNSSIFNRKIYQRLYIATVLNLFLRSSVISIGVFFAGNMLGPAALATAGLLMPLSFLYMALGSLFEIGGSTVCSRYIGENDFDGAKKAVTVAYTANLLVCLIIAAFGFIFMDNIMNLLKIPADMLSEAKAYTGIFLIGGFFSSSVNLGSGLLKFDGKTTAFTISIAVSPFTAIVLTYGLIRFAGMGLTAIALGMNAGYALTALTMMYMVAVKSKILGFARTKAGEWLKIFKRIIKNGMSQSLTDICLMGITIITNALIITTYGQLAISAYSAFGSLVSLLLAVSLGSAVTLVQLAGVTNAERDSASVKQFVRISLIYGLSLAFLAGAVLLTFSRPIANSFGMGFDEAYAIMRPVLIMTAILVILDVFLNTIIILYNTIGRNIAASLIGITRKFASAAALLYIFSAAFGLPGVWASIWASAALTIIIAVIYSLFVSAKNKYLTKVFLIDTEAEKDGTYTSFSAENNTEDIVECSQKISVFCKQNEMNKSKSNLIALAIEEMLLLIMEHSKSSDPMNVRVLLWQDEVIIRIRSGGINFNPLAFYQKQNLSGRPALNDDYIDSEFLGLKMVVDTVKNVDYRRTFDVNNLTVTISN